MNMIKKVAAVFLPILVFLSVPPYVGADAVTDAAKRVADVAFSEAEREAIEKYYGISAPNRSRDHEARKRDTHDDDGYKDKEARGDKKQHKGKGKEKDKSKNKNKQKAMPAGIAKKLERGGAMPPGIARTRLPSDLELHLPPPPRGFERIETDGKVVLAETATGVIADIIRIGRKSRSTREELVNQPAVTRAASTGETNQATDQSGEPRNPEKKWWQFWKD